AGLKIPPLRIVAGRWGWREGAEGGFDANTKVAPQPPIAPPQHAERQRRIVDHGHRFLLMRLPVKGKAGVAGSVSDVAQPPPQRSGANLPVTRVERLPAVAVVEAVGTPEIVNENRKTPVLPCWGQASRPGHGRRGPGR